MYFFSLSFDLNSELSRQENGQSELISTSQKLGGDGGAFVVRETLHSVHQKRLIPIIFTPPIFFYEDGFCSRHTLDPHENKVKAETGTT